MCMEELPQFKAEINGGRKQTRQDEVLLVLPWVRPPDPQTMNLCVKDNHPTLTSAANRDRQTIDTAIKSDFESSEGRAKKMYVFAEWKHWTLDPETLLPLTQFPQERERGPFSPPQSRQRRRHPLMSRQMTWAAASFFAATLAEHISLLAKRVWK